MMESGKMDNEVVEVFIRAKLGINIKESGEMINLMGLG